MDEYEALNYLYAKGRISNKEQWRSALDVVKDFNWILIKWAKDVKKIEK